MDIKWLVNRDEWTSQQMILKEKKQLGVKAAWCNRH